MCIFHTDGPGYRYSDVPMFMTWNNAKECSLYTYTCMYCHKTSHIMLHLASCGKA